MGRRCPLFALDLCSEIAPHKRACCLLRACRNHLFVTRIETSSFGLAFHDGGPDPADKGFGMGETTGLRGR